MANCYKESSLNRNVVHNGKYDTRTKGICGIKDYWIDIIPELNEENINTLIGGAIVLKHMLDKNNNDLFFALKEYKGSKKNLKPVYSVIDLYNEIR